jgi:cholesterol oxidase
VTIEPKWDPDKQQYPVMENWPVQLNQDDYTKARAWMEQNRGELHQVVTRVPLPPDLRDKVANLPAPYDLLYLWKSRALKHAAEQMGAAWEPLDLALIEFVEKAKEGTTKLGDPTVQKTFCERQARCFLGCLPGARHTLNKTLLNNLLTVTNPLVSLRSLAEVDHIRSLAGGGYEVVYRDLRDGSEKTVSASKVILAAGCLGSTELLLRSRAKGTLTLSDKLGGQFSSNGDFAGFVIVEQEVGGKRNPVYPVFPTRGPINTSHAMFQDGKLHMTIEDGAIPPMFASVTGAALSVLDNAAQRDAFMQAMRGVWIMGQLPDLQAFFPLLPDPYNPKRLQTEDEMVMNIFFFNCMGTDDAKGKFELDVFGNLKLSFPEGKLADHPVFQKTEGILKAMAEKMGGRYVPFPLWQGLGNRKIVTVHPLGGCPMGNSSTDGVVDMKGRVFKTRKNAKTVHDGLYVMDASIIPGPLAVNPTLTIVALALKIAEAL